MLNLSIRWEFCGAVLPHKVGNSLKIQTFCTSFLLTLNNSVLCSDWEEGALVWFHFIIGETITLF